MLGVITYTSKQISRERGRILRLEMPIVSNFEKNIYISDPDLFSKLSNIGGAMVPLALPLAAALPAN